MTSRHFAMISPRSNVWHGRRASRTETMVEKRPIWRVPKEEEHSEESAETAIRSAGTKERIVLSERKRTEDPEAEETENHAHTVVGRVTTRTHAENCILTRHHNGLEIK